MPAHSRLKNGVAEPVIGPREFARARWLAYVAGIHVLKTERAKDVDGRNKSGHDGLRRGRLRCCDAPLDIRHRIDYIVPISFTEGPFARVLSKVERERFPEARPYTVRPGGSGHRPSGA